MLFSVGWTPAVKIARLNVHCFRLEKYQLTQLYLLMSNLVSCLTLLFVHWTHDIA